jgi:hypothetical protein
LIGEPYSSLPGFEDVAVETIRYWLDYGVMGSRRRFLQGPFKHFQDDSEWFDVCKLMQALADSCIARGRVINGGLRRRKPEGENKEPTTLMNRFLRELTMN